MSGFENGRRKVSGGSAADYHWRFRDTGSMTRPPLPSPTPHDLHKDNSNDAANLDIPSNILFVDGLPTDSSRREVAHIFRPFFGFVDIKLLHKEPRNSRDKPMVLCFVEFSDANCALTALKALQGYKFDKKKPNSGALKIHFATFPFKHPSNGDEQRRAGKR